MVLAVAVTRDRPARPVAGLAIELDAAVRDLLMVNAADLARAKLLVADAGQELHASLSTLCVATERYRQALSVVERTLYDSHALEASLAGASSVLLTDYVRNMVRVSRESMATIEELILLGEQLKHLGRQGEGIDEIARQTRLVALNARIEAQRAIAGDTFQGVADEAKRLANASLVLSQRMSGAIATCERHLASVRATAERLATHDMSSAIHAHQGLGAAITVLDRVQRELCVDLSQVDVCVSQTVRVLQFEDMVTQLLELTVRRSNELVRVLSRILSTASEPLGDVAIEPAIREVIVELRAAADRNLVQQTNVAEGSVDLF